MRSLRFRPTCAGRAASSSTAVSSAFRSSAASRATAWPSGSATPRKEPLLKLPLKAGVPSYMGIPIDYVDDAALIVPQ
ncbi:hypothetical protein NFJ02_45g113000 [Pycnococcus provasolii]